MKHLPRFPKLTCQPTLPPKGGPHDPHHRHPRTGYPLPHLPRTRRIGCHEPRPDYSAAYCIIETDSGHDGHGLTFTIGRGNELCVAAIRALAHTPGAPSAAARQTEIAGGDRAKYERLLAVLKAHDVRYFLYNGGNDSADTAWKVSQLAQAFDYPLTCIGVPKTVDNDLAVTDTCPGFGSAAKYTAVSVREAALDVAAMAETSTKVFVYEAMGRHAGWLAAAAGWRGSRRTRPLTSSCSPSAPTTRRSSLRR